MSEEKNIREENNEQNESQILNPNSETENMEVHHHPDLDHKRKNFKEYFLEFLKIFLAVTMGFFSENIRESIKDKRQVNEYMVSMVNDAVKKCSFNAQKFQVCRQPKHYSQRFTYLRWQGNRSSSR
jgi:hypothetical protein